MKYKRLLNGLIIILSAVATISCSESFLEVAPKGLSTESNYYSNPDEAYTALVAAYSALTTEVKNTFCNPMVSLNSASDDCYCGGGGATDGPQWQALNDMTQLTPSQVPDDLWGVNFFGVKQCNLLLSKVDGVPGLNGDVKARYIAEAKFLRAYYYFNLVNWFGNVPIFTSPQTTDEIYTATQSPPSEVYAQIEIDLKEAIANLPATLSADEKGRATLGAAKTLLGKAYLFQKKWGEAASTLKDVNGAPGGTSQYGYKLLDNYGDIFNPGNKFHAESIFEIYKTGSQNFDWGNYPYLYGNMYNQEIGPRGYSLTSNTSSAPDIWSGWSFNPITPDLVDAMVVDGIYDPRYNFTIINLDSLVEAGQCVYDKAACFDATGYIIAKYVPLKEFTTSTLDVNHSQNIIVMRLADSYLMEAEALVMANADLDRAQALLDALRARVALPSVPVSLHAIKLERRLELATEGLRYFDLIRWGDAEEVLNNMKNGFSKHFIAGKNEVLPIPLAELSNTLMVQNPGY